MTPSVTCWQRKTRGKTSPLVSILTGHKTSPEKTDTAGPAAILGPPSASEKGYESPEPQGPSAQGELLAKPLSRCVNLPPIRAGRELCGCEVTCAATGIFSYAQLERRGQLCADQGHGCRAPSKPR
jgi:hypothetical protein